MPNFHSILIMTGQFVLPAPFAHMFSKKQCCAVEPKMFVSETSVLQLGNFSSLTILIRRKIEYAY